MCGEPHSLVWARSLRDSCHQSIQSLYEQAAPTPSCLLTRNLKCSRSALSPFLSSLDAAKLIINWTANINVGWTAGCQLLRGLFSHALVVPLLCYSSKKWIILTQDANVDFFVNGIIVIGLLASSEVDGKHPHPVRGIVRHKNAQPCVQPISWLHIKQAASQNTTLHDGRWCRRWEDAQSLRKYFSIATASQTSQKWQLITLTIRNIVHDGMGLNRELWWCM